jgi:hypothetical protein
VSADLLDSARHPKNSAIRFREGEAGTRGVAFTVGLSLPELQGAFGAQRFIIRHIAMVAVTARSSDLMNTLSLEWIGVSSSSKQAELIGGFNKKGTPEFNWV